MTTSHRASHRPYRIQFSYPFLIGIEGVLTVPALTPNRQPRSTGRLALLCLVCSPRQRLHVCASSHLAVMVCFQTAWTGHGPCITSSRMSLQSRPVSMAASQPASLSSCQTVYVLQHSCLRSQARSTSPSPHSMLPYTQVSKMVDDGRYGSMLEFLLPSIIR